MAYSDSDGEIVERGEMLKVPKAQPLPRASSVDRNSRASSSPHFTSPNTSPRDITPALDDSSLHSHQNLHQKGTKRPHMGADEQYQRGGRRDRNRQDFNRREPHRQDSRRHESRYEDSRHNGGFTSRSQVSYADIDSGSNGQNNRHVYEGYGRGRDIDRGRYRDRHEPKRQRTRSRSRSRSRSPYYAGKVTKDGYAIRYEDGAESYNDVYGDPSRHRQPDSTHLRNTRPGPGNQATGNGEAPFRSHYSDRKTSVNGPASRQHASTAGNKLNSSFDNHSKTEKPTSFMPKRQPADEPEEPAPEPVDEAAEIEARRLKREAIKARLKSQPESTLGQELSVGVESLPSSPGADKSGATTTRSGSPILQSPKASLGDSAPGSPMDFILERGGELTNTRAGQVTDVDSDFQSAADYDPMMDMQEDKRREALQRSQQVSAADFNELDDQPKQVLIPESQPAELPSAKQDKDDYDMFADDVDDAIFAPSSETRPSQSTRAVPLAQGTYDDGLRDNWTDAQGYYIFRSGDILADKYEVKQRLGQGVFSSVVRAVDTRDGSMVAIKIIRNNETMYKAALKEIGILQILNESDPDDKRHLIRFFEDFMHRGHMCMVFELLKDNLRDVLKQFGRTTGLNIKAVRHYAYQMFLGLSLLKKCNIIHADLKPDNILCYGDNRNQVIKICDLGSAADISDANERTSYLASRYYRAPEVIVGCPYSFAMDIWAIGCTLFELYTGNFLFCASTNNQMLKVIMETRGKISIKMLKKGEFSGKHFEYSGDFRSVELDKTANKEVVRMIPVNRPTRDLRTRVLQGIKGVRLTTEQIKELEPFIDLLDKCLTLNPDKRITPGEALKHPFFDPLRKTK